MPITHTNAKGQTFSLYQGTTKIGKPSAVLSRFLFLLLFEHRIQPLSLAPCRRSGAPPIDGDVGLRALVRPGSSCSWECGALREPSGQTLPCQPPQLALGAVQPGALCRGVVPCHLARHPSGVRGWKALRPAGGRRRLPVRYAQNQWFGCWVSRSDQQAERLSPFPAGLACGHAPFAPPRPGLPPAKAARRPLALLRLSRPRGRPRLQGARALGRARACLARVIQPALGARGLRRPRRAGQAVVPRGAARARRLGTAPGLSAPRWQGVCCSRAPTAPCLLWATSPRAPRRAASSRSGQRGWPAGGALHASASECAATSPVSFWGARGGRGLSYSAAGRPPARKRRRPVPTGLRCHRQAGATASSVKGAAWLRSRSSRRRARVGVRAGALPVRLTVCKGVRGAAVKARESWWLLGAFEHR